MNEPTDKPIIIVGIEGDTDAVTRVTYGSEELTRVGRGTFTDHPYCVHDVSLNERCQQCVDDTRT